ncbi:hypothetical protein A9R00_08450 [Oleispira antarctica]|uniref:DUF4824 domain-containing protein n=1 Tax=Oleispira antarctica TaxID=188908 RepID=A0A1Y5HRR4_OLEAN|nr:hypothetical protein A9R00_08450 [Oleispira antarctica]
MKHLPGSRTLLILALSLVLLVNSFILIGVWYNRSGEAESTVLLTEREMRMPYSWSNDQTFLRISWRNASSEWFDQQKLESLGFDFSEAEYNTHFIETKAILVLEYDGDAYQQAVKIAQSRVERVERKLTQLNAGKEIQAELNDELQTELQEDLQADLKDAQDNLKHEKLSASRLFIVDAGLDEEKLRTQYPDNQRYILTYGIVDVRASMPYDENETLVFTGRIDQLSVKRLHIESEMFAKINKLKSNTQYSRNTMPPRFSVEVHFGQRLEPWIEQLSF